MTRGFLFFWARSLSQRKGRLVIASVSVTLAVAVVTGLIGLTAGIRQQLGAEIKAYGANMIVYPVDGGFLDNSIVQKLASVQHIEEAAGQISGTAFIANQPVEVLGVDTGRLKGRGWRLQGMWPAKRGEALAGVNLKEALKLKAGSTVRLEKQETESAGGGDGRTLDYDYRVTGFVERGGPEDNQLILLLPDAQQLLSGNAGLSSVLLRGSPGELDGTSRTIKNSFPFVGVKTLRNVASAEASLLAKIQLLLLLVTLVVLFAGTVTVGATMGANVLERRQEIGLMKALGGTRQVIGFFYTAEAAFIGILGGFAGLLLGGLCAEGVSKSAFHSFIPLPPYLGLVSPALGVVLAVVAAHLPVKKALRSNAAMVLRGE